MPDDRATFAQGLAVLATALQQELDTPQIAVYWHSLKQVPREIWREAFAMAAEQPWRRFPQPGELKAICAGLLNAKRKTAAALHLADCPHSGHWLEDERGNVLGRCPCWR